MHINPRTYNILMAIRKAAFDEHSFAMPEILRHCAVANVDTVKTIIHRVRKGADALPYAHFFDVMYTDSDVRRFITAFAVYRKLTLTQACHGACHGRGRTSHSRLKVPTLRSH